MCRLYTEVKASTTFIKPRAKGTRFDKSTNNTDSIPFESSFDINSSMYPVLAYKIISKSMIDDKIEITMYI